MRKTFGRCKAHRDSRVTAEYCATPVWSHALQGLPRFFGRPQINTMFEVAKRPALPKGPGPPLG